MDPLAHGGDPGGSPFRGWPGVSFLAGGDGYLPLLRHYPGSFPKELEGVPYPGPGGL